MVRLRGTVSCRVFHTDKREWRGSERKNDGLCKFKMRGSGVNHFHKIFVYCIMTSFIFMYRYSTQHNFILGHEQFAFALLSTEEKRESKNKMRRPWIYAISHVTDRGVEVHRDFLFPSGVTDVPRVRMVGTGTLNYVLVSVYSLRALKTDLQGSGRGKYKLIYRVG